MVDVKKFLHDNMAKKSEQISPIRVYKHPYQLKRDRLARLFGEWGFTEGAEIGVRAGKFSEVLCKAGLSLKCVDPWGTAGYRAGLLGEDRQEAYYNECVERLAPYDAEIIRRTSMDAVNGVEDESLDFVYIDGSHEFDDVMMDIIMWSKKVRQGGVVAGHDYYKFKRAGVIEAAEVYTKMHKIYEWYITDEKEPSFFWVKE